MRVRSLLGLGCTLAALLIGARLLTLELGIAAQQRLEAVEIDTERVARNTAELMMHSHELLRGQAHGERQWRATYAELAQALARLADADARLQPRVAAAREFASGLPPLFDATAQALRGESTDDARRDMLAGHLLAETRRVGDEAFALSEAVIEMRRERVHANTSITRLTMAAFALLLVGVAVVVARRVLRPMTRVEAAARAMRAGDLGARARYQADDEFGCLAQAFDSMASTLQEREEHLQGIREEVQRTLDAIPALVGYWDPSLRLRFANDSYVAWFGIDRAGLDGMHMSEVLGERYDFSRTFAEAALRGQAQVFERPLMRADGGERHSITQFVPDVVDGTVRGFYCCVTDITGQNADRARLAAALAENGALLAKLSANEAFLDRTGRVAGVGGWEVDLDSGSVTWSAETRRIHEVDDSFVPDLTSGLAFYASRSRATIDAAVQRGIAAGTPWDLELELVTARGRTIWVRAVGEAAWHEGRVNRLFGAFQDITARKQLELQLADSERFLRQVTDGLPIRIAYFDTDLRYRFVNAAVCERFGLEREQILGRTRQELLGDTRSRVSAHGDVFERHLRAGLAGEDQRLEITVTVEGELRYIESRMTPARDAQGRVVGLFTAGTDITDRKQAELELRNTSALLGSVLESASEVSIIATDPQLNITVFNRGAERLLGWGADEMVGKVTPAVFHDAQEMAARGEELSRELGHPVEGGAVFIEPSALCQPREWTYVRKDASRVTVSLVVTAMLGDDGQTLGYLGIAHDVTQQKQAEARLRVAMERAHHASRTKSQFLANMSHEIRTPMNAVIGLSFLLAQTRLDAEQSGLLGKIETASRVLLALLNDVLDLSKVEAGELAIEHTPFDVAQLLRDLADIARVQTGARRIAFDAEIDSTLPPLVTGDPTRLNQVLMNLVTNAVKFTESGGVVLRAQVLQQADAAAADEARVRVRFEVQDTGIGIEPAVQARLFAPFVQADASITRRFGGTGLGLSIVKTLVVAMGGTVAVRSEAGHGSTFIVELPFKAAPLAAGVPCVAASATTGGPVLSGVRVLVVDDSEINLDVARRILEREGAAVTLAANGLIACERVHDASQAFDIVLMDVQMPVLDGYGAARFIRQTLDAQALPIIALTAGALSSERQRAKEAGMNAYVSKPFDPRALVRTIREYVTPREAPVGALSALSAGQALRWPAVDGIDAADVRERLDGDVPLFVSMLRRLLDEFGPFLAATASIDATQLGAHAARLHKLRGTAGMLGARALHVTAGNAETAARAGDVAGAQHATHAAAQAFEALARAAAPLLAGALDDAASAGANDGELEPIDAPSMQELARLLREHSLEAIDRFEALAARLKHQLGDDDYQALRRRIDGLEFDQAAQALEQA